MAPSKWRTECVGEEKENEPTAQEADNEKKLNEHCEDVTVEGKENQVNAETLVVFLVLVWNCLVSNSFTVKIDRISPLISLAKVPVLTRLREKRRPPPLRIVEDKELVLGRWLREPGSQPWGDCRCDP